MKELLSFLLVCGGINQVLLAPSYDLSLVRSLQERQTANIVVTMKERTTSVLNDIITTNFHSRSDRLNTVASRLQNLARNSQRNILQVLDQERSCGNPFMVHSLWITNQIFIQDADLDLVQKLSAFSEVASISEEKLFHIDEPRDVQVFTDFPPPGSESDVQWGVARIEAPKVWEEGHLGAKIIVASIDTGVRVTHEALRDNHRRDYGWFDPPYNTSESHDNHGHGTHTMGTIAGTARNIGVAPRSQWITCKGCTSSSCFQNHLLRCAQWILCPTDPHGNHPDCSKAPHLVSNSWGGSRGSTWYADSILAWRASGIIPLFSIGNTGPSCFTASSPGDDENAIGVGSTTSDDVLSPFSSVGPTYVGMRIKPDVAAPGSNVFSAYHTADYAYASMSGTSMASPHAAGTVALLMSFAGSEGNVEYEEVKMALEAGAVETVSEGKSCMGLPDTERPNHHVGHGRINAHKSLMHFKRVWSAKRLLPAK